MIGCLWSYRLWYERNKSKLSEKRKEKYKNNFEYREKVKKKARDYYREKKAKGVARRRAKNKGIVEKNGKFYYTISYVGKAIGRSVSTLRMYESKKIIPGPKEVDPRGWRLYSGKQLSLLTTAFGMYDNGSSIKILSKLWEKELWEKNEKSK